MEQLGQQQQPVMGVVSGAPQIAYAAPYQSAPLVASGTGNLVGAVAPPAQTAGAFAASPGQLTAQHQLYQQLHHQQQQQQQQQLQQFWTNQIQEIEQTNDFKNHSLPLARIKKIMKADEDVRMIAAEAPVVFAKACEMFILELTLRSWIHTEENKRRTLQKNDIAAAITRTDIFDFLVDIVPRDEQKEDGLGLPRAALPAVGMPPDAVPYYYVAPQPISPVAAPGMMVRKSVDQAALYASPQPSHPVSYITWQQPQFLQTQGQEQLQQQQQISDSA